MQLTDIDTIRRIMRGYKIFAQKKLGQHFLVSQEILDKIVETAQLKSTDTILEIGPGLGTLTRPLASKAKRVIAVEKDSGIIKVFKSINTDLTGVTLVEKNALSLEKDFFKNQNISSYKLVANLPYYLTSPIIRFFLQVKPKPKIMVLMVQKEVAERIVAKPPNTSLLSIAIQFYGEPTIIREVSKDAFWPKPKVDSAIIKILPHPKKMYKVSDDQNFFRTVKAGFGEKRKQLHNSLSGGLNLSSEFVKKVLVKSHIDNSRRAQTLTIPEWIKLYNNLNL